MYCQNRISTHTEPPTQPTILHFWQQRIELKIYDNLPMVPIAQMWQSKSEKWSFLQNIRHAAQDIVIFSEQKAQKTKKNTLVCTEKHHQLGQLGVYVIFEYWSGDFLIRFTTTRLLTAYDSYDCKDNNDLPFNFDFHKMEEKEMLWRCLNHKIPVDIRHLLTFLQNTRAMMPWYLLFCKTTSDVCWVHSMNPDLLGFKKKNDFRTNSVISDEGANGFAGFQYAFGRVTQPSVVQMRYHLHQLRRELREHRTATQEELIQILTPWIRAWKAYYAFSLIEAGLLDSPYLREQRHNYTPHLPSSREVAKYCDHALLQMLWRWACRRHPKKSRAWVKQKYFHVLQKKKWVFAVWDSSSLTYTSLPSHG